MELRLDNLEFVVLVVIDGRNECLFLQGYLVEVNSSLVLLFLTGTTFIVLSGCLGLGHLSTIITTGDVFATIIIIKHPSRSHLLFFNVLYKDIII
jgi:hypothetical protein